MSTTARSDHGPVYRLIYGGTLSPAAGYADSTGGMTRRWCLTGRSGPRTEPHDAPEGQTRMLGDDQ